MTDQQDLRARLPKLPEPKRFFGHSTNMPMYTSEEMKDYALEAAAQLGRVGDETIYCEIAVAPATIFGVGVELSTVIAAVRARKEAEGTFAFTAKVRDRVAEPQLPAGVPDVELIDRIFNEEIKRVSTVEFDSNAICRKFYGEIRKRLVEQQPTPQPPRLSGMGVCDG